MTHTMRATFAMALLAGVCLLTNAPACAQSVYGSIFGTVTDKTGAVIPDATVTVTDEAKGTVETVVSNGAGDYTVSHLIPDIYDLKVEVKGFKSYISKGIVVQADTAPRVDVGLEVSGGNTDTITVSADSVPQLKTDRADVADVFDQQQVNELPVGDQNFTNLQLLLPGAQLLGWSHAADENPQGSRQIQVDGQAFGGVAFELDGTDNQDPILGIIVFNPTLDAVTETKITTQNFDAELGKAVASVVTAQTRSGSNSFHGSVYDYRTSNANLAREPFSQGTPDAVPDGLKNRFGGSIGGRIIRDRLFFFGNYEGQRQKVGTSITDTLPSNLLTETCLGNQVGPSGIAGCDFSQYSNPANLPAGQGIIYDNSSGTPTPFPNNVIPATRVSKQAINLLTLLEPYTKQISGGGEGGLDANFHASGTGLLNSDSWTTRVDGTISAKQNAFVRFSRFTSTLTGGVAFGAAGGPGFGLNNFGGNGKGANDSLAIGTDYVLSPKLVTDVRLGYYRYNVIDSKFDQGTDFATELGMPGLNMGDVTTSGAPSIFIGTLPGGATQPTYGAGLNINRCNCPLTQREDQFQIVNNWTKTWGNHSVKLGGDLRYGRNLRVPSDSDRTGILNFNAGPTSNPSAAQQGGLGFASLVLGDVTSFNRFVSTSTNAKEFQKRTFFYAQDTWRASSNLTLNLGVRWEFYFPETVNAAGNGALLNLKDGYLHVAGIGGIGSNMGWEAEKHKQFEPRIGFAYQLNPKTVIRAGYGRSFDTGVFGSIFGHTVTQNLPVLANQAISNSTATGQAFCLGSPADNPGCNPANNSTSSVEPAGGGPLTPTPVAVPQNGLLPNPGSLVTSKARQNPLTFPTIDAWNLSFQRALTPSLSMTIAYVGNKGTHTLSSGDGNNTNPNEAAITLPAEFSVTGQPLHYDPSVTGNAISATGGVSNQNLLERYYGGTLTACQDANYVTPSLPYITPGMCGWNQSIQFNGDDQNTNYNAMQVTIAQQAWKGLSLNANYAWQSSFNHAAGYSTWDKRIGYGRDDFVRQNAATVYGSYQLPFGKGRMFVSGASRVLDAIIGGYQLSGTMNLSTGLPFTLTINCGNDLPASLSGNSECYPNVASGVRLNTHLTSFDPKTQKRLFYTKQVDSQGKLIAPFFDPGLDNIGNNGRNTYWGPGFFNTDLSLLKKVQLRESLMVEFRVDAYNAVNHINPANPGGNITSDGTIGGEAPGPGPRQLEFALRVQF